MKFNILHKYFVKKRQKMFVLLTTIIIFIFMVGADAFIAHAVGSWAWPKRPSDGEIKAAVEQYTNEKVPPGNKWRVVTETIVEKYHDVGPYASDQMGEPGTHNGVYVLLKTTSPEGGDPYDFGGLLIYDSASKKFSFTLSLEDFYASVQAGNYKKGWADAKEGEALKGTLSVRQVLKPPARLIDLRPNREFINKLTGMGTAELYLDFQLENPPAGANAKIVVDFEIDSPSQIVGEAKGIELKDGKARVKFKFNKSKAEGEGGVIFARVKYPANLELVNNVYTPAQKQNSAIVKIKPLCSSASSIFYKDNLISDIKYDSDELKKQFQAVIEKYGAQNTSASSYNPAGLLWFLASPAGEMAGKKIQYYTGNEVQLKRYLMEQQGKAKVSPSALFGKALEINKGDVTNAFLACHNILRASARGAEDFRSQLTKEELELMDKKAAEGLTKEQAAKKSSLLTQEGSYADIKMYDQLETLRPGGDNMGAWYHLFGTATLTSSTRNTPPLPECIDGVLPDPSSAADDIVWVEEYLISGDIYSDPNEYCMDMTGANLGRAIHDMVPADKVENIANKVKGYLTSFKDYLDASRKNNSKEGYIDRMAIHMRCPVTTTITDRVTKRYFKFNQSEFTFEGDLPVKFVLKPEGEYFSILAYVPGNDIDITCESVANGKFSLTCYDFASDTAADYGPMYTSPGFVFSTSITGGDLSKGLSDQGGDITSPKLTKMDPAAVKGIRCNANEFVLKQRDKNLEDSPKTVISQDTSKQASNSNLNNSNSNSNSNNNNSSSNSNTSSRRILSIAAIVGGSLLLIILIIIAVVLSKKKTTNVCPRCHAPLEPGSSFCTSCGYRIMLRR